MAVQLSLFANQIPENTDPTKVIVRDGERFERLIRFLKGKPLVFDYETSGLAWYKNAAAIGIGLGSWDEHGRLWAAYVPFRHRTGEQQLDINRIGPAIKELLGDPITLKIAYNIKFEDHFSRREGWSVNGPRYDPMIGARLYNENEGLELEHRAATDLGYPNTYEASKVVTKVVAKLAKANRLKIKEYKNKFGYSEVPINVLGIYCCVDVQHTGDLYTFYEQWGLSTHYNRIWPTEMRLTTLLTDMEQNGIPIDVPYLEGVRVDVRGKKQLLEAKIFGAIGRLDLGSDDQIRKLLLDKLHCKWDKLTKAGYKSVRNTGTYNPYKHLAVDGDVLKVLAKNFELLQWLLDWREADKIDTTYTTSILSKLDSNNWLHGDLQQVGTVTGRLSCKEPNYQNMPTGPLIRTAFLVIGTEWVKIFLDYSQIELRVLAFYSRDPLMVQTYLEGGDIHETTRVEVSQMAGRELDRRTAKVINFGLSYCLTEQGLSNQADIPLNEATSFLSGFFQRFSGVAGFREELWALARRQNCQWNNIFGRTRRVPTLRSNGLAERKRAERQLIATAIQGTAAELTKESLVRIGDWLEANSLNDRVRLCNTVHDEIQLDVHRSCLTPVVEHIKYEMERYPEFAPIPIIVDTDISETNWGAKEDYKKWSEK